MENSSESARSSRTPLRGPSSQHSLQHTLSYTDRDRELSRSSSYRKSSKIYQDEKAPEPIKKSIWTKPCVWILIILFVVVIIAVPSVIYVLSQKKGEYITSVKSMASDSLEESGYYALTNFCNRIDDGVYKFLLSFDASDCQIGDAGFSCFIKHVSDGKLSSLKEIHINNNNLNDYTLSLLLNSILTNKLPSLELLSLSGNTVGYTSAAMIYQIETERKGQSLKTLDLSHTQLSDVSLLTMLSGMTSVSFPQMNSLYLNNNLFASNTTQYFIQQSNDRKLFSSLQILSLSSNSMNEAAIQDLSVVLSSPEFMPNLNRLFLENIYVSPSMWFILKQSINVREKEICVYIQGDYACNY